MVKIEYWQEAADLRNYKDSTEADSLPLCLKLPDVAMDMFAGPDQLPGDF